MRGTVVVLCVCVTTPAATYLVYMMKTRCHLAFYSIFKVCIVWISLKKFPSKVLATFADHYGLLRLMNFRSMKETAMASFQD